MTLLVISPDYASHLLPLLAIAASIRDEQEPVVVATGPATAAIVADAGHRRVDLRLGRGSNPGVIRAQDQPAGEDDALRGFFEATRHGMVETLAYQARARRNDLLWQPLPTAAAVLDVLTEVAPDRVLVDHLALSATLALQASGTPYLDAVLGHPSALPVGDEVYGYPVAWPACFTPDPVELVALRALCVDVRDAFTADWNAASAVLDPGARPVRDAFAVHGSQVLFNYPAALHDSQRTALLPPHTFLESSLRPEPADGDVEAWLGSPDPRPIVYVSFGSFLSARSDVLARVVAALAPLPVRVALATGSADLADLGELPPDWLVRGFLPQITILRQAALAVTHGGNNSVTEAVSLGLPMLALPFSTDQFAGAAALETAGLATVLDPNRVSARELHTCLHTLLAGIGQAERRDVRGMVQRRDVRGFMAWCSQ